MTYKKEYDDPLWGRTQRVLDERWAHQQAYLRCKGCAYKGNGCTEVIENCGAYRPMNFNGR